MGPVRERERIKLPVCELEISNAIDAGAEAALNAGLAANAIAKNAPPFSSMPLQILRRNAGGKIVAGLTGKTFWNWLYIDILWVEESARGQGLGAALVRAAEEEAVRRGCLGSYLWIESYEGPGFYAKLGYKEFVAKQDFPVGFARIGFMKRLAA